MMPRARAWMFSSVVSGCVPDSAGASVPVIPATASSIGNTW
jgi:hypothetical protein